MACQSCLLIVLCGWVFGSTGIKALHARVRKLRVLTLALRTPESNSAVTAAMIEFMHPTDRQTLADLQTQDIGAVRNAIRLVLNGIPAEVRSSDHSLDSAEAIFETELKAAELIAMSSHNACDDMSTAATHVFPLRRVDRQLIEQAVKFARACADMVSQTRVVNSAVLTHQVASVASVAVDLLTNVMKHPGARRTTQPRRTSVSTVAELVRSVAGVQQCDFVDEAAWKERLRGLLAENRNVTHARKEKLVELAQRWCNSLLPGVRFTPAVVLRASHELILALAEDLGVEVQRGEHAVKLLQELVGHATSSLLHGATATTARVLELVSDVCKHRPTSDGDRRPWRSHAVCKYMTTIMRYVHCSPSGVV